jgi:hypothetical protein
MSRCLNKCAPPFVDHMRGPSRLPKRILAGARLRYPDGSRFVLQRGFMYRIPLFQDPEHILDSSEKMSGETVGRGHYSDKPEVWGEVDYTNRKSDHPGASLFEIDSPNLGYEHVPVGRGQDFARALDSFVPI